MSASFLQAADERATHNLLAKALADAEENRSFEIHGLRVANVELPPLPEGVTIREVDICGNAFTTLPGAHILTPGLQLKCIAASRNAITSLPLHIKAVTSRKLLLQHNKLQALGDALPRGLMQLDASSNLFAGALEIHVPTTLNALKLASNAITTLSIIGDPPDEPPDPMLPPPPPALMLSSLDASHNRLEAVPAGIGGPESALSTLKLAANNLCRIPDAIAQSGRLMELDVSHNALESLPWALGGLTSLRKLNVSRNRLTELPASVWALGALLELHAAHNQLAALPPPPAQPLALVELVLAHNALTRLDDALPAALPSLTRLDVTSNALTALPAGGMANLRFLHVGFNLLDTLGTLMDSSPKLTVLHARGCDEHGAKLADKPPTPTAALTEYEVLTEARRRGAPMGLRNAPGIGAQLQTAWSAVRPQPVGALRLSAGVGLMCGRRRGMEDCASLDICPAEGIPSHPHLGWVAAIAGVYDGHGGDTASQLVAAALPSAILEELSASVPTSSTPPPLDTIEDAVATSFARVAAEVAANEDFGWEGTTATVAMILNPTSPGGAIQLLIANVGDSAAALLTNGGRTSEYVSAWHRPEDPAEEDRIVRSGGYVSAEGELNGMLGVARTLGDTAHPPPHCAVPSIRLVALPPHESATVVLASDGLWDVMEAEEVAQLLAATPAVARHRSDAGEMAQALRDEAFVRGSTDNISVVVLCLRSMGDCVISE